MVPEYRLTGKTLLISFYILTLPVSDKILSFLFLMKETCRHLIHPMTRTQKPSFENLDSSFSVFSNSHDPNVETFIKVSASFNADFYVYLYASFYASLYASFYAILYATFYATLYASFMNKVVAS